MIFKILFIFFIFFTSAVNAADDIAEMESISEAAGNSAESAAKQLASDAGKISDNIKNAASTLGTGKAGTAAALDTTLSQASKAIDFAKESLAKGDIAAAVQTMSLVESATDLALSSIASTGTLDMGKIDFAKEFSPEEMVALSSIAGQMGAGKVVALQKMAGQMAAANAAGFDSKEMMNAMDANGMGIGSAMAEMAKAGMVDMEAIAGSASFNMENFNPSDFASMNVAEMGMSPAMMMGALNALPVGAATAALESMQAGTADMAKGFEDMKGIMNGAIASTLGTKGMGTEMMSAMGKSMGISDMADLAADMQGVEGMKAMTDAMKSVGIDKVANTITTAFSSQQTGITSMMGTSVGMISGAISGKPVETTSAVAMGSELGSVASKMNEAAPTELEMPENVSDAGMMMGAMVMTKSMMAGGLPGAMAPPKGMTAIGMAEGMEGAAGLGEMMDKSMMGESMEAMSAMTGMNMDQMSEMGIDKMAASTGLTPGMMATMGSIGITGMDMTSIMSTNVAGLGSKTVSDLTAAAASGDMSAAMMGDMMQTGLVNQGTMAAMGTEGMTNLGTAMGMEGGDMGLASMSGGISGMGKVNAAKMDPAMAESMGIEGGAGGIEQVMGGIEGGAEGASMNLGQVSAAMGAGKSAEAALESAAGAAAAAEEAGAGIADAAAGAAAASQEAAAAMGAMTGMSMEAMGEMGIEGMSEMTGMSAEAMAAAAEAAGGAAGESGGYSPGEGESYSGGDPAQQ
jgi:hypothetical protein